FFDSVTPLVTRHQDSSCRVCFWRIGYDEGSPQGGEFLHLSHSDGGHFIKLRLRPFKLRLNLRHRSLACISTLCFLGLRCFSSLELRCVESPDSMLSECENLHKHPAQFRFCC